MLKVSAPGKIVLSGEHAVVYGYPAILASVDRRIVVSFGNPNNFSEGQDFIYKAVNLLKKNLQVKDVNPSLKIVSDIPVGSGMGSSAALSVALSALFYSSIQETDLIGDDPPASAWSVSDWRAGLNADMSSSFGGKPRSLERGGCHKKYKKIWDLNLINDMAYQIERIQHGNPSGGDNTVSCFGGFLWFRKKSERKMLFTQVKPTKKFPKIIIFQSGRPKETTGEMVAQVRDFYVHHRREVEKIFNNLESVTKGFLKCLNADFSDISILINENERLLEALGVVSDKTRLLIRKIKKLGGAAKVSGAGGKITGSGILIAYHKEPEKLFLFAKSNKLDTISVRLGGKGVKIE